MDDHANVDGSAWRSSEMWPVKGATQELTKHCSSSSIQCPGGREGLKGMLFREVENEPQKAELP